MLYYNRIDISEGVDVIKTNEPKECDICHCWYFLDKGFSIQTYVSNGFHALLMMLININDIATLNINSVD